MTIHFIGAGPGAGDLITLRAQRLIAATLAATYGGDCPGAVVAHASRPDEVVLRGTLGTIASLVAATGVRRTATIVVGPALDAEGFRDSHLYGRRSR